MSLLDSGGAGTVGVVDSEDLPLSLSREKPQDSNLIRRIRDVLTRKLIRHLEDQSKEHPVELVL
jgi:TNF receptor-associated protein 1